MDKLNPKFWVLTLMIFAAAFVRLIPVPPAFKESIKLNNIYVNLQIKRYQYLKKFIVQLMADIEAELVENKISS